MAKVKKNQKKAVAKKVVAKKKAAVKKPVAKKVSKASPKAKPAAKKTAAKKSPAKPAVKKPAKKAVVKKTAVKKSTPAKKAAPVAKKATPKAKSAAKKVTIKETSPEVFKLNSKTVKPQGIMQPKNSGPEDTRTKYSEEELKEFETLILEKLERAKKELVYIKESLSRKNDESSDNSNSNLKLLEDGADTLEKENFSQLAARQMKFIQQLEFAVIRIKNGTYGVCIETGKLIPKERLRAVPHTQHSIEAKLNRK
ncbi:MAG: putative suppressor protein [Chitinophagaceae bacterium]|nr:putative suppressor protein [Chitinophagaceae bacterium]